MIIYLIVATQFTDSNDSLVLRAKEIPYYFEFFPIIFVGERKKFYSSLKFISV